MTQSFNNLPACETLDAAWDDRDEDIRDLIQTTPLVYDVDGLPIGYDSSQLFGLEGVYLGGCRVMRPFYSSKEERTMTNTDDTKPATAHTAEPWQITGQSCRDYEGAEIGTGNKTVAVILTADAVEVAEEERTNARRIVAVINACQGISTEALEQGIVAELLANLKTLLEQIDEDVPTDITTRHFANAYDEAVATLAKATGRAA